MGLYEKRTWQREQNLRACILWAVLTALWGTGFAAGVIASGYLIAGGLIGLSSIFAIACAWFYAVRGKM